MIELTAERWPVGKLICTVERLRQTVRPRHKYQWRVIEPEGAGWPPGERLIAYGTAADADGAWQDAQNAARDWLATQQDARTECPHDAQESRSEVSTAEGQVDL